MAHHIAASIPLAEPRAVDDVEREAGSFAGGEAGPGEPSLPKALRWASVLVYQGIHKRCLACPLLACTNCTLKTDVLSMNKL